MEEIKMGEHMEEAFADDESVEEAAEMAEEAGLEATEISAEEVAAYAEDIIDEDTADGIVSEAMDAVEEASDSAALTATHASL